MKSVIVVAFATLMLATDLVAANASNSHAFLRNDDLDDTALLIPHVTDGGFDSPDEFQMPEGGVAPVRHKHVVEWKESQIPLVMQWALAAVWIFMLAAIPFVIKKLDGRAVTNTQIIVGGCELLVLFGGFFLFTKIILFQSAHFKEIRPLTIVECIYFMSQVITTVGYGDIGPAKIRGQVFVGMYVLGALFVIAMLMTDLTNHMIEGAKKYREKLAKEQHAQSAREGTKTTVLDLVEPEKPSARPLIIAFCAFGVLDVMWILFFSLHPLEGKSTFQALYMSVITLSSVGFGYFTPVTETGMVFGAFMMIFGCSMLVNVITAFTELMVKMNEWESFRPEKKTEIIGSLRTMVGNKDTVTESQFLQFCLINMKLVNEHEIGLVLEAFKNLKPSGAGTVTYKAIENSLEDDLNEKTKPGKVM